MFSRRICCSVAVGKVRPRAPCTPSRVRNPPATSATSCRNFASLQELQSPTLDDATALQSLTSDGTILTGSPTDDLERYNVDWKNEYRGNSSIVARPKTTDEICRILKYCNDNRIGVVPQGGNTGLVGGSVPVKDEIIISLERMKTIHDFDDASGILTCDAGCVLQDLHSYAEERKFLVPIDLGAKGTCQIGGNVSTNAGGQYYFRFGSLHANILGLEVALPDGTCLDLLNANRKDNTGYDMKHLFIGAEGTLGIVTKINLSCPRLTSNRSAAFLALESFDSVRNVLTLAKDELGECLAAFEFMDRAILKLVEKEHHIPIVHGDSDSDLYPFYLLVETQGSVQEHDEEKMAQFLEKALDGGDVIDGVLSQDTKQLNEMWNIREACNPSLKQVGYNYKYDISIPISEYYEIAEEMRDRLNSLRPDVLCVNWGHVIDGNLHFNASTPNVFEEDSEVRNLLEPYIFESVVKRGGSISAEHGLGRCKNNYLGTLAKNPAALAKMRALKSVFDPHGIMNPGKFLPTVASDS